MTTTQTTDQTITTITTMGGVAGNPAKFTATYNGHTWNARKVDNEIYLSRTCTGCWSPSIPGKWTTSRHTVEDTVTVADIVAELARIDRIRAAGFDEIADERDANAFRITTSR